MGGLEAAGGGWASEQPVVGLEQPGGRVAMDGNGSSRAPEAERQHR